MSIRVMEAVWNRSQARDGHLLVLLAIADCANDHGANAFPSNAELRRKSRLSERGVRYAIHRLQEIGELVVEPQAGPGGCNRYRIVLPPPDAGPRPSDPRQDLPPARSAPGVQDVPGQGVQDLPPGGNSAQQGGQYPTEIVSQIAPVTVIEPSLEPSTSSSGVADATPDRNGPRPEDQTDADPRDDVDRICEHLAARIVGNGSKRPTVTKRWRDSARLMLDRDGRTEDQVHAAIDWCQNHDFWRGNILSLPKLREKYDQLRLAAERERAPRRRNDDIDWDAAMQRARDRDARQEAG